MKGFMSDIWGFMKERKKWWLIPAILGLLAAGALFILSSGPVTAPLLYTFF